MNARKFADNNNNNYYYYYGRYDDDTDIAAFVGNQSINCTVNKSLHQQQQQLADESFDRIDVMADVVFYLVLTLGIPGNVLSAVVWLRSHVARKNSSAIYLAALAINDVVFLLRLVVRRYGDYYRRKIDRVLIVRWLWRCLGESARILEPLLVLSLTIDRLFAIIRPLQVSPPVLITFIRWFHPEEII